MASSSHIKNEINRLAGAFPRFCAAYDLPFVSPQPVFDTTLQLLHIHPQFYRQPPVPPANPPARPAAYVPCTVPTAVNGRWVGLDGPAKSTWIPGADPELYGAFIVSGLHGDETSTPEIVLEVCEILLNALAAAAAGGVPAAFVHSGYSLPGPALKDIVGCTEFFVVPMVNAYGRDKSNWYNRRNVNLNRNFPFLWTQHHVTGTYYGPMAPRVTVTDAPGFPAAGASALSEQETQCIAQLHMALPLNLYLDCHTNLPDSACYPWACDGTQTTKPADCWAVAPLGRADGASARYSALATPAAPNPYDEFMPAGALATLAAGGAAVVAATTAAGKAWKTGLGLDESITGNPPVANSATAYIGASDDFAFSLDICNMRVYTLEANSSTLESLEDAANPAAAKAAPARLQYQVAMLALFDWYAKDIRAGTVTRTMSRSSYHRNLAAGWPAYWAALSCVAGLPAPPAAPAPAVPPSGTGSSAPTYFYALRLAFRVFLGALARLLAAIFRPPPPAAAVPVPSGPPVHALRLNRQLAGAGQPVHALLLDRSLDFTAVNPAFFSLYLHVPPVPGALGMIYHRVPHFRFLSARELEFTIDRVGTLNPAVMTPPGDYIVLCRYGFWSVESDRTLRVH